jgi:hypothetical protein
MPGLHWNRETKGKLGRERGREDNKGGEGRGGEEKD